MRIDLTFQHLQTNRFQLSFLFMIFLQCLYIPLRSCLHFIEGANQQSNFILSRFLQFWAGKVILSFAVVTDLGNYDDEIVQQLQGLDTLLLEANHDIHMLETGVYPYPLKRRIMGNRGHLSNERSGQLLCELLHDKFGTVVLGHLSKENNYEELAYEAVRLEVTMGDNPYKADDFPMYVAKRNAVSPVIRAE